MADQPTYTLGEILDELGLTVDGFRHDAGELGIEPITCGGVCGRRFYAQEDVERLRDRQWGKVVKARADYLARRLDGVHGEEAQDLIREIIRGE